MGKVFLGKFHDFGGIWWPVVGGVVGYVEYGMACTLEFPCCSILKPDVSADGHESKEDTGGGVGCVQF